MRGSRGLDEVPARRFDVVCAGEALWHLVAPHGVRSGAEAPLRFRPGGGAVSVAVTLARRGLRVGLATSLADDRSGRRLRERVAGTGVDVSGVVLAAPRTGLVVLEGSRESRRVVSYRDEEQPAVVPAGWSSQILLLSGLSPVVANAASFCKAARAARRAGTTVVLDVNARRHVWAGRDPRATHMALREADVVHARVEDLDALGIDETALRRAMQATAILVTSEGAGDECTVSVCFELVRAGRPGVDRGDLWVRVTSPSSSRRRVMMP
jgi:sugar/nucleoside kinase (ribokinase family)